MVNICMGWRVILVKEDFLAFGSKSFLIDGSTQFLELTTIAVDRSSFLKIIHKNDSIGIPNTDAIILSSDGVLLNFSAHSRSLDSCW